MRRRFHPSYYLDDRVRAGMRELARHYAARCGWSRELGDQFADYYVNVCEAGPERISVAAASFLEPEPERNAA